MPERLIAYVDESYSRDGSAYALGCVVVNKGWAARLCDTLRARYDGYLRLFGKRYVWRELKFSNLLNALKGAVSVDHLQSLLIIPAISELSERARIRAIVMPNRIVDAYIRRLRGFRKHIAKRVAALLVLLSDVAFEGIVMDKGVFKEASQLAGALRRVGISASVEFSDSLTEPGIQLADFVAGASRYLRIANSFSLPRVKVYLQTHQAGVAAESKEGESFRRTAGALATVL